MTLDEIFLTVTPILILVYGNTFQLSLIFASKAGANPSGAPNVG